MSKHENKQKKSVSKAKPALKMMGKGKRDELEKLKKFESWISKPNNQFLVYQTFFAYNKQFNDALEEIAENLFNQYEQERIERLAKRRQKKQQVEQKKMEQQRQQEQAQQHHQ